MGIIKRKNGKILLTSDNKILTTPNTFTYTGSNPELVAEYNETWTLADTSFVIGSSASTSATSIKAAVSNRFTSPTIAFGDKDIIFIQRCVATPIHSSEATGKVQQNKYVYQYVTYYSKRKTSPTSAKTTRQAYNLTSYLNDYLNTSGVRTRSVANYGFYMTPSAPSVASATAASTTARCSSPVLYYRVSTTYESADNIKLVTDCTFDWNVKVYTLDAFSTLGRIVNDDLDNMLLEGTPANVSFFDLDDEIGEGDTDSNEN